MTTQSPADLDKMSSTFRDQPVSAHGPRWDDLWRESFTPWDRGGPSLALDEILRERPELFSASSQKAGQRRKRALVPGCGRGYDVLLLRAWGYDVWGLDFSAEATAQATENERVSGGLEVYATRPGVAESGQVSWVTGDFFGQELGSLLGDDKFDLIFDYTVREPSLSSPDWVSFLYQQQTDVG